ncbi:MULTISPECIES: NYN domain-containing protein [Paraburkholderia]|uniref:NYN domain-containing protein n=1 Tax=Paraburkholderia TaxID=1822464 RepID=UPI002252F610|nr:MULTISPECIES: NYN domain-containing protein [Paraburkholderia]MCX4163515.1 NYN domain-containing protein [Paraburkholderia megapolitana]MDN7159010.1 NYN domain-containing protein [Paraburkholderia sp. CHISQ3]MDQ6496057.1 NYN domain-containing protein [Paraburkholderia megapolitana]
MASIQESASMALFCDFENVALGVRDAKFEKFDIKPILERLLLKGSIVVKKAYCDWERYKGFKAAMHEASFELIEIPHVRQSGKNSADIRLVVDALDLCYTKSHVDTFVIISGDSDFSPLVSKLRENAKKVIGVGVKQSTSDLLVANCDEFIFYDDLVREQQRAAARREPSAGTRRSPDEDRQRKKEGDERKNIAIALAVETFDALAAERGESGKIWASVLKSAIKRRKPDFSESYYGFRAFGNLLDEVQARGLFEVGRDEKSGSFVYRSSPTEAAQPVAPSAPANAANEDGTKGKSKSGNKSGNRPANDKKGHRKGATSGRQAVEQHGTEAPVDEAHDTHRQPDLYETLETYETYETMREPERVDEALHVPVETHSESESQPTPAPARKRPTARRGKPAAKKTAAAAQPATEAASAPPAAAPVGETAPRKPAQKSAARKSAARPRRPRKAAGAANEE